MWHSGRQWQQWSSCQSISSGKQDHGQLRQIRLSYMTLSKADFYKGTGLAAQLWRRKYILRKCLIKLLKNPLLPDQAASTEGSWSPIGDKPNLWSIISRFQLSALINQCYLRISIFISLNWDCKRRICKMLKLDQHQEGRVVVNYIDFVLSIGAS